MATLNILISRFIQKYSLTVGHPFSFQCSGTFCQPGTGNFGQKVEITSSVTFIDVSTPAISARGEPPVFLAKIPYDFFYPFISGAATASPALWLTIALVIASV